MGYLIQEKKDEWWGGRVGGAGGREGVNKDDCIGQGLLGIPAVLGIDSSR